MSSPFIANFPPIAIFFLFFDTEYYYIRNPRKKTLGIFRKLHLNGHWQELVLCKKIKRKAIFFKSGFLKFCLKTLMFWQLYHVSKGIWYITYLTENDKWVSTWQMKLHSSLFYINISPISLLYSDGVKIYFELLQDVINIKTFWMEKSNTCIIEYVSRRLSLSK